MSSLSSAYTISLESSDIDIHLSSLLPSESAISTYHHGHASTQLLPTVAVIRSLSTIDELHPTELLARSERKKRRDVICQSVIGASVGIYLAFIHIAALLYILA